MPKVKIGDLWDRYQTDRDNAATLLDDAIKAGRIPPPPHEHVTPADLVDADLFALWVDSVAGTTLSFLKQSPGKPPWVRACIEQLEQGNALQAKLIWDRAKDESPTPLVAENQFGWLLNTLICCQTTPHSLWYTLSNDGRDREMIRIRGILLRDWAENLPPWALKLAARVYL